MSRAHEARPEAPSRVLGGNEPLLLDGRHAWLVTSGTVAVFVVRTEEGVAPGARRYLFSVAAGESILWNASAPAEGLFEAIPIERAEVRPVPMEVEMASVAAGDADAVRRFDRWFEALGAEISAAGMSPAVPAPALPATVAELSEHLHAVQGTFLRAVAEVDRRREGEQRRRLDEREQLHSRLIHETLAVLAYGAGAERAREIPADEPPLLAAVRRVGAACGVGIRAPATARADRDALQSILEASGARARRVRLTGRWWTRAGGPLLAYRAEGGEPIALLPERGSWRRRPRYRLHAGGGAPAVVDASLAASLSPTAHVLHGPLPDRASTREMLRFALYPARRDVVFALLAAVAATLLAMLTPQAARLVVEHAVPDADRRLIFQIGVALAAAAAGALLLDVAQAASVLRTVTSTAAALQIGVWDRLLRLSPSFFRRFTAGDLGSRARAVTQIRFLLNETAIAALVGSAASLLNFGLMLYYSVPLALAGLLVAAAAALVTAATAYRVQGVVRRLQEADGQLNGLLVQLVAAVPKLQAAGAETRAYAQWGRAYGRKMDLDQQLQALGDRVRVFSLILSPLAIATLFWLAGGRRPGGGAELGVGAFVAFSAAFGAFLGGATALGESTATVLSVAGLWNRARPILDAEPEVHAGHVDPGVLAGRVRMDHVTFRYRADGPLTLDDVSLRAEPGELVAIVGTSGSGKSTIVSLLLRFETPLSGAVYYDGHDLKGLDALALRRQLGVVTQENRILAGSLYDNIVCGGLRTMDEAWEAARAAGLDEDIRQMPMGMHTFASEGGGNLSGGQRQRLLIARSLVQKPRVVILDEATSALDNRAQAVVTESLNALRVTRIMVAHRLSTVRHADRIYVIESGRVVQEGPFDELMNVEGLFARLMRRQTS
jgi:ATP-binding cassette subfamily C protein